MKTDWLMHRWKWTLAVLPLLVLMGVVLHMQRSIHIIQAESFPTKVFARWVTWDLDIAATNADRTLGLGERDSYPENRAMLFLFPYPDRYGFWMKGMRFPIDIIFLSKGRVISIERSLQPSDDRIVMPPEPADQVLEVNAGKARHLSPGDRVWYWRPFF